MKRIGLVTVLALLVVGGQATAAAAKAPVAGKSIIGGAKMNVSQVPYVVSVLTQRSLCSGSVVSPLRVVTAAHCVDTAPEMLVRAGSSSSFFGGQEIAVDEVRVHSEYRRTKNGGALNDIAVLELAEPAAAAPIELSDTGLDAAMTATGAPFMAAGFGQAQLDLRKKRKIGVLRSVLQFSRPSICRSHKLPLSTSVCTVGERMGTVKTGRKRRLTRRTPCHGDSGGPLIGFSPSGPRLVGVLSTGGGKRPRGFDWVECGLEGQGVAYTRVSAFLSFINGL